MSSLYSYDVSEEQLSPTLIPEAEEIWRQEAISCSSRFWLPRFRKSHFFPLRDDH